MARGEVLGWLNADDAYAPHAVAEAVAALEGVSLVYADVTRVNDDGANPRRIRSRPEFDLWTELNAGLWHLLAGRLLHAGGVRRRRRAGREPAADDGL